MSKKNNIGAITLNTANDTAEFFNNIFDQQITITSEVDQAILAFFEKRTGSKVAAKSLAGSLILTCASRGVDPIDAIDRIVSENTLNIDVYTAMLLNLSRANTSVLGVVQTPAVSPYITRTIIA